MEKDPKNAIELDPYTFTSSPLEMWFGGTKISIGTCFFWRREDKLYLVTNWHNVTGKNPRTGKHLSENLAEPDSIVFDLWLDVSTGKRTTGRMQLFNNGIPRWREHPVFKNQVDVVCIELPQDAHSHLFPINEERQERLKIAIADEVYLLGFPLGIGVNRLPIWKRASIASEPEIDAEKLPLIYVDTASAKGMSGSPVILRRSGGGRLEGGTFLMNGGNLVRFLGIYSGRLSSGDPLDAQLGLVWKARVIDEIIDGEVKRSV